MIYDFKRAKRIKDLEDIGLKCLLLEAFFIAFSENIASIFMLLAFFCFLILKKIDSKRETYYSNFSVFIAIFVIFAFLSTFVSPDKFFSLYNYSCLVSSYVLTYFLTLQFVRDPANLRKIMLALFLSFLGVLCFAYWQILRDTIPQDAGWVDREAFPTLTNRIFSTFENPNIFAGYLAGVIAFAVGLLTLAKKKSIQLVLGMGIVLSLPPLALTYARGAFLALILTIIIYGFLKEIRLVFLSILGIVLLLYFNPLFLERISSTVQLFSAGAQMDTSLEMRLALFESTIDMIFDHLFLGIGWGAYYLVYPLYDFYIQDANVKIVHAHNMYLNYLAEIGIFGAGAFFILFFGTLKKAWSLINSDKDRLTRGISLGVFLSLCTIAIGGLSDDILFNTKISLFLWLTFALIGTMESFLPDPKRSKFLQEKAAASAIKKQKRKEKIKNFLHHLFPSPRKDTETEKVKYAKHAAHLKKIEKTTKVNREKGREQKTSKENELLAVLSGAVLAFMRTEENSIAQREKDVHEKITPANYPRELLLKEDIIKEIHENTNENSILQATKAPPKNKKILIERTEIVGDKNILRQVLVDKEEYKKILQAKNSTTNKK